MDRERFAEHISAPAGRGVPVTGGTLMISSDGARAIVSDPDRDRIVTIDLATGTTLKDLALSPGDEPGRLVEDALGRVHVALRRGGAIVTIDATGAQIGTFGKQLRKYSRDAKAGLGGRLRRDGTRRDLGYPPEYASHAPGGRSGERAS